ncbi:polygalacturonase [Marivivens niveibacter]|uniref:Polygalacturonase n=1 Tax=Marivivens niveibacter TaxID=1930667 RepID=A0A251WWI6_9RHOB|nr:glycoside hydrolase family 28 protein [Marivivens niveibacter]OUD08434.1 polygalacturonase [Marivivens niveibacter]
MTQLRLTALSARTLAFCLPLKGAKYHLPAPMAWQLNDLHGQTDTVVTTVDGLEPDTEYQLSIGGDVLEFKTPACSGLVRIDDHGASAGGHDTADRAAANARAFTRAIAATPPGGTVEIPIGDWICGPVALRSDLTVLIRGNLIAPSDRAGWPKLPARSHTGRMLGSWEGLPETCFAAPIHAVGQRNITIAGPGQIDGGGSRGDWWTWPKETREDARRPRGIHLIDCSDVQLIGFAIDNAPSWTIHPQGCRNLTIAGLHISAPHDSPNTDGCNPEMCENVTFQGVRFSVGDDCIAIKSGKRGPLGESDHLAPTKNVSITHCLMERGHGGVVLGSEMSGDITDVTVSHCEMKGTDRGLRLKTRRGRGGRIDRITFQDVILDSVETAFSANAFYHCDADGHDDWVQSRDFAPISDRTPKICTITIQDVEIRQLSHAVGAFIGLPESPIGPISVQRVTIDSYAPDAVPTPPIMADHIRPMRHAGIAYEFANISAAQEIKIEDHGLSMTPERTTQ